MTTDARDVVLRAEELIAFGEPWNGRRCTYCAAYGSALGPPLAHTTDCPWRRLREVLPPPGCADEPCAYCDHPDSEHLPSPTGCTVLGGYSDDPSVCDCEQYRGHAGYPPQMAHTHTCPA
jgi:hypothetical protein